MRTASDTAGLADTVRKRVELFGVHINALTMQETVDAARALVAGGGCHQHVVVNAAKVVAMHDDPRLTEIIRSCSIANADGTSVVWAARLLGRALPERVTGIDLFERLVAAAADDGRSVFLLGARPDVVEAVAAEFQRRHPGLKIAGAHDGYWTDDGEVVAAVRSVHPDYLFVAIPSPRKEFWLHEHRNELNVAFAMGVGGSFDVIAGRTKRAPRWMQRAGLEWFYRFAQEPRRMWKRYLVGNSRFIAIVLHEWRHTRR